MRPVPKGRPRVFRSRTISPHETVVAERTVQEHMRIALRERSFEPFKGPVHVAILFEYVKPKRGTFSFPPKHDIDNLAKLVLDAANRILWKDDNQVVTLSLRKAYGEKDAVHFTAAEAFL